MFNMVERENPEILIQVIFRNNKINCVLHTNFNSKNDILYILVPGLLGDRTDSRHMLVRLARELAKKNCNVLRFDYLGGGSSEGDYTKNDFQIMMDTLQFIIEDITKRFTWLKKIGFISFSEAGKICVKLSNIMNNICFIGFCNAILVEETNYNAITRPKLIKDRLVYDSNFGTWINWNIVEQYKNWCVATEDMREDILYDAVYSDSDPLTEQSLKFVESRGISVNKIAGADHLFTSNKWLEEMINHWSKKNVLQNLGFEMEEFFVYTSWGKQCVRYKDKGSSELLVFVHGVGQNKSGPGFLYNQISSEVKSYNMLFFDFYGYGDSDFEPELLNKITLSDYINQLDEIINYISATYPFNKLTLLGTGVGCAVIEGYYNIAENNNINQIYFFPQKSKIWYKLDEKDKSGEEIDTYYIYKKYSWAEEEFCILGNVSNRIRGMMLPLKFLYDLYMFEMKNIYDSGIVYISNGEKIQIEVQDSSHLLMSSKSRDITISDIIAILEDK